MSAQDDRAVTTPFLLEWIEAELAVLEAFHAAKPTSADEREYFEKEAPLALENAKACLSELKSRIGRRSLTDQAHPADTQAQPLQTRG